LPPQAFKVKNHNPTGHTGTSVKIVLDTQMTLYSNVPSNFLKSVKTLYARTISFVQHFI